MNKKIGRNDICPCGSGKKYKNCCLSTQQNLMFKPATGKKKFTAKLVSPAKPIDLMERTYGAAIQAATERNKEGTPTLETTEEQS